MSLDIKPLYLNSFLRQSLNIENFEYSYFIPILSQTAEYWGDAEVVSICNRMSQQVKEYLNHTAFVFFYIHKKKQQINENSHLRNNFQQNLNKTNPAFNLATWGLENLKCSPGYNLVNEIQFQKIVPVCGNTQKRNYNTSTKILDKMDENMLNHIRIIQKNLDNKQKSEHIPLGFNIPDLTSLNEKDYFLLLKKLQYRKFFKATKWYPLLSQIASAEGLVNFSQHFYQIAQSEQNTSMLLKQLAER